MLYCQNCLSPNSNVKLQRAEGQALFISLESIKCDHSQKIGGN